MKNSLIFSCVTISVLFANDNGLNLNLDTSLLTGNTRLACEAILCLSSSIKPGACSPSLKKFFSIRFRHWGDTIKARRNFLKLCPSRDNTNVVNQQNYDNYVNNTLVNLSSYCDANSLNDRIQKSLE